MVITVQGYNGKKNKAVSTIAALASMSATVKGAKTLIFQLVNKDINSVEYVLRGMDTEKENVFGVSEMDFTDDGIDSLLRTVDAAKLMKADFDSMCVPLMKAENRFDIATMTRSNNLIATLPTRIEAIENLIINAKDVYENIFILLPPITDSTEEVVKAVNELEVVDKSAYCVTQGFYRKGKTYGRDILYVVTDFENTSTFSLNAHKTLFENVKGKTEHLFKIAHNVEFNDVSKSGRLLRFVSTNRALEPEDANYRWSEDMKFILSYLTDTAYKDLEVDDSWITEELQQLAKLKSFPGEETDEDDVEETDASEESIISEELTVPSVSNEESDSFIEQEEEVPETENKTLEAMPPFDKGEILTIETPAMELSIPEEKKKKSFFGFGKKKEKTAVKNTEELAKDVPMQTDAEPTPAIAEPVEVIEEPKEVEAVLSAEEKVEPTTSNLWVCSDCGTENSGKFCFECGSKKPMPKDWTCPECGTVNTGKFCPECGTKRPN